jgi:neopullulanase
MKSCFNSLATCVCLYFMLSTNGWAQKKNEEFQHVEPPFWWTGMKNHSLQILFHNSQKDISGYIPSIAYDGVSITDVKKVENPHYLFVTLDISGSAKAGTIPVTFKQGKKTIRYDYELKAKTSEPGRIQGFDPSDVIYLIMPDRFANGDEKNDSIPGMYEGAHRENDEGRHGGDLQGLTNHIGYFNELGVTAIWLNPVMENNQKRTSYHGYAITDLYNVDRRFGGNSAYLAFIEGCHRTGLKVIQDMVMNHIGDYHWMMNDLPEKDWVNQFPQFTRSNYRGVAISDPYRSKIDERLMSDGWFDKTMPDVNQRNPLFATYLIQNSLWWIQYGGLDGIRMDTYPYPDKDFMATWSNAVMQEFPEFNIVGEVWLNSPANIAYWQKGMVNKDKYSSGLPSATDFPLCFAIPQALHEAPGWETGMAKLYNTLAMDFVYPDPFRNVTFVDNHDMTRFFLSCGRDIKKFKMGLAFLLTTRGIPQLYYGTELLMDGDGGHHPNIRLDFPGGWKGDATNAFTSAGRTEQQQDAFDFISTLLKWRKNQPLIHTGKLTHYIPEDNVYVYFRHDGGKAVMVILNANQTDKTIKTDRFAESIGNFKRGKDVLSNLDFDLQNLSVKGQTSLILELE